SPLIWKDTAYEAQDDKVEDACTLGFELEGKFDSDMKAGIESKWDVWEWGAARTNPTGYALDRTHVYSKTPPPPADDARRRPDHLHASGGRGHALLFEDRAAREEGRSHGAAVSPPETHGLLCRRDGEG